MPGHCNDSVWKAGLIALIQVVISTNQVPGTLDEPLDSKVQDPDLNVTSASRSSGSSEDR